LKWNSTNQYWFVENWPTGQLISNNTSTPPITGWYIYGNTDTVTVKTGECTTTAFSIKNVIVTNPTCLNEGCSGGIEIQIENGTPPIIYSIDNGVTTSNSPLFTNLCPAVYNVWARDANNIVSSQVISIPNTNAITQYKLKIDSTSSTVQQGNNGLGLPYITKILQFVVRVKDINNNNISSLPIGTSINFDLLQTNIFDTTTTINTGTIQRTIEINKNGVPISLTTTSNQTSLNDVRAGCETNLIYRTNTQKTATVQIQGTDLVSGFVQTTITKVTRENCALVKAVDSIEITSEETNGCVCCNVVSVKEAPNMNLSL